MTFFMKTVRSSFLIVAVAFIGLMPGCATPNQPTLRSTVLFHGSQEVPKVVSRAKGIGEITVLPNRVIDGRIVISDVVATAAHIHFGAPETIGPAIITLTKISETSFTVPPDTRLSEAQYRAYHAGNLYINVHSAIFPGGEIRGQIYPPTRQAR